MTLRDLRNEHKRELQRAARKQLGMHPGIRVFPSAEGDLSPLTVRDAALISHDLLLAAPSVKHDTITIARDHLPLAGIKVSKR